LIPIMWDQMLPNNVSGACLELTKLSETLWTTKYRGEEGPPLMRANCTIEDLKQELLKATILDAKPKSKELEDALESKLAQELEYLGDKANPDNSSHSIFIAINKRISELEKAMKETPPDRLGHYMQFREIQKSYLDRLAFATKAQSLLEQGKVNLYEIVREYKSQTEILWWDLQSKNAFTYCNQLDAPTLAEQFSYSGLVLDEVPGCGIIYHPPPSLSDMLGTLSKTTNEPIADMDDDIQQLEEEIKEGEKNLNTGFDLQDVKRKRKQIAVKKEELRQAKRTKYQLKRNQKASEAAINKAIEEAGKVQQATNAMLKALDEQAKAFEQFASGTSRLKALWQAAHPDQGASSFMTAKETTAWKSQKTKSQTHADAQSSSNATTVEASAFGARAGVTHGTSQETEQSRMKGTQEAESHVMHFECEGCYGSLDNDLLKCILKAFNSDKWYIDEKDPGYLWKQSSGKEARFYVAEILFARKCLFTTSDQEASGEISALSTKSASASSTSASAGWGPVSIAHTSTSGQAHTDTSAQASMKKDSKDNTYHHANIFIKFLLLKPLIPAPKRSKDTPKETDVDSAQYASQHLGTVG